MCTLTYIPLSSGFLLTNNRDETPTRAAHGLFHSPDERLIYPKEPQAGGTWICVERNGRVACLLNGAFEKHRHLPPYRRSRGLLVLDFFEYDSADRFFKEYDFTDIEPFTFIICEGNSLYEFRWDEQQQAHQRELNPQQAHIWSSSPLYPAPIRAQREAWFRDWLAQHPQPDRESMLHFHQTAGQEDPENGLLMCRFQGALRTIGITSILQQQQTTSILYKDLTHGTDYHETIVQS